MRCEPRKAFEKRAERVMHPGGTLKTIDKAAQRIYLILPEISIDFCT